MPSQSRAQRRRQAQRAAPRPAGSVRPEPVGLEPEAEEAFDATPPLAPAPITLPQSASARSARASRRSAVRVAEPVDYSQDYASARRDLLRILIISVALFAVMVGLSVAGLF